MSGNRVIAHGHTFVGNGTVIAESGRESLLVLLDEAPEGFPDAAMWFSRDETEPEGERPSKP